MDYSTTLTQFGDVVTAAAGNDLFGITSSDRIRGALFAILGLILIVVAIRMNVGRQNLRKQGETVAGVGLTAVVAAFGTVLLTAGTGFLQWLGL